MCGIRWRENTLLEALLLKRHILILVLYKQPEFMHILHAYILCGGVSMLTYQLLYSVVMIAVTEIHHIVENTGASLLGFLHLFFQREIARLGRPGTFH